MPPFSTSVRDFSEDITIDKDGGVKKIIVSKGAGLKPLNGDLVYIRYVGFLESGVHFTSNLNSDNDPLQFKLGNGDVLKAWDVALPTMQEGEKCVLYCHYSYAYGFSGLSPLVRPNTNCLFEIELLRFEGEDVSKKKDGSVRKSIIETSNEDSTNDCPYEGATCNISYECYMDWKKDMDEALLVQDIKNTTISLGDVDDVVVGVDRAIRKMRCGEKARVIVSAKQAYGSKGNDLIGIPPNHDLLYILTLHHFTNVKQHWQMSREELLQEASVQKDRGSSFYKKEKYYQARRRYSRALLLAESVQLRKYELASLHNKSYNENEGKKHDTAINRKLNEIIDTKNNNDVDKNNELTLNKEFRVTTNTIINKVNILETLPSINNEENLMTDVNVSKIEKMVEQKESLRLQCLLNLSACRLKLNQYLRAYDAADRVLQIQENCTKALYRRAMAHYNMANYMEAKEDLKQVLQIEPTNSACVMQVKLCDKALQQLQQKQKQTFEGMFTKFALFDLQKGNEEGTNTRKDVFSDIGEWENHMADGMMTLEQEMEAFGESMPQTASNHSDED